MLYFFILNKINDQAQHIKKKKSMTINGYLYYHTIKKYFPATNLVHNNLYVFVVLSNNSIIITQTCLRIIISSI